MVRWLILIAAVSVTPALGQQGTVRVVKEQSAVADCERLTQVRGSSLLGGIFASAAYDSALNEMKDAASAAGGTHLLLLDLSSGHSGANGLGEAYRCGANTQEPVKPKKKR